MRFDLTCDGCGAPFSATPQLRQDPGALWHAASERGWMLPPEQSSDAHRCGDCSAPMVRAGVATGDGR
jgi:hypothetical protein